MFLLRGCGGGGVSACRIRAVFSKHIVRTGIYLLKPGLQLLDFKVTSKVNLK